MNFDFLGLQIIIIGFSLFMVYLTNLHFRRREFSFVIFCIWIFIWVGLLFFAVSPDLAFLTAKKLGVVKAMNLFTILGFVVLLTIIFRIFVIINKIEKKLSDLVRREALQKLEERTSR